MNTQFDWTLIRSFLAALDCGSLLGASRVLKLSQPTVGRHIAELESQLGVVLFERTGRGLSPLEMALRLADSARAMEAGAFELQRSVSGAQADAGGTVRITASQPVACVLLPPVLARMRLALPEVHIELVASNEVTNLLRREADIALRMVQPDQSSLVARKIGKVTLGAYAHRSYLEKRGVPLKFADVLSHDLIGFDRNEAMIQGFASVGFPVTPQNFILRTDDMMAYWHALCSGIGIGFVAHYMARSNLALSPLLPMLKIEPLPLWLAVHREIRSNRRIRAVYDFLADELVSAL